MSDIHVDTTSSQVLSQFLCLYGPLTPAVTFSRMSTIHITTMLSGNVGNFHCELIQHPETL